MLFKRAWSGARDTALSAESMTVKGAPLPPPSHPSCQALMFLKLKSDATVPSDKTHQPSPYTRTLYTYCNSKDLTPPLLSMPPAAMLAVHFTPRHTVDMHSLRGQMFGQRT